MKLDIYASSSRGNFYVLTGIKEKLLIEAGIGIKQIKKNLDYDFSMVNACLLSHEHSDHSKSIKDLITLGVRVYSSAGTFDRLGIKNHYASPVKDNQIFETEEFKIKPFKTEHDCADPLGYLIHSKTEFKNIVFATDTYFLQYKFHDINTFMIEINFIKSVLDQNVENGSVNAAGANRIEKSHYSLEKVIKLFDELDLSKTKRIIPIHTSARNGDPKLIKEILERRFGIPVIINKRRIII